MRFDFVVVVFDFVDFFVDILVHPVTSISSSSIVMSQPTVEEFTGSIPRVPLLPPRVMLRPHLHLPRGGGGCIPD